MKRTENNGNRSMWKILVPILLLLIAAGAVFMAFSFSGDDSEEEAAVEETAGEGEASEDSEEDGTADSGAAEDSEENGEAAAEEGSSEITISTVGDIMVHDEQYWGAYVEETDSYDFKPWFEHVKPYLEEADLAIGNFETTVAGEDRGYTGYPLFNTPDEIVEDVKYAGFDALVTSNNHSLDMGAQGVERTVQMLEEADLDVVGTYDGAPEERHVIREVDGIRVAMLAFTEMLNGMEGPYTDEEVYNMIDVISEENLTEAIDAAKADDPDIILTYMHWGPEYVEEPSDYQKEYAQFLADQGVDLIIGSHPHVIQRAEYLESADGESESFVVYSLGNFISNQRLETIGPDFEPNEDGVILNFDIEKDHESGETVVADVHYTPTWVYRHSDTNDTPFDYEILPVEDFQDDENLPADIRERLDRSLERTHSRLNLE
ncbi:poly-gamma-glutamate synthesis protein (capsule biosynthesis protein) [Salinicoccus kekensis]|uniref:Poly-gamma-glutamate synthesis protein (Capsule biosynthesis protein) n=2 Tax=Salinicoccus kekensis TaxID=714307 RepID=A0A285UT40_9STAP|nr:poly-gamma-glutamate synthesis protein (capsule biosynthesis protein) [Salinicoccus kekensis]